jgi:hypothetical protein
MCRFSAPVVVLKKPTLGSGTESQPDCPAKRALWAVPVMSLARLFRLVMPTSTRVIAASVGSVVYQPEARHART